MARTRYPLSVARICIISVCCLWTRVGGQEVSPYATLPSGIFIESADGEFLTPSGNTSIYDEGSIMNIRWDTTYPSINLYNIWQENITPGDGVPAETQVQITTGSQDTSVSWIIECKPDCSRPYTLHAVNAEGSDDELLSGGFWSRLYWIRPSAGSSSSSAAASTTSSSSTALLSESTVSSPTPTSSEGPVGAPAPSTNEQKDDGDGDGDGGGSSNGTAIGAGVGVGVGVTLALIGAFFLWRRYSRKRKESRAAQPPTAVYQDSSSWPPYSGHFSGQSSHAMSEVKGSNIQSPIEAPAVQSDPHELPAGYHVYR